METLVLFLIFIYLSLKGWPVLRVFVLLWRCPNPSARLCAARDTPSEEHLHLFGVAQEELAQFGYENAFLCEVRLDTGETTPVACFTREDRPDTVVMVSAPVAPLTSEWNSTLITRMQNPEGQWHFVATVSGVPKLQTVDPETTRYTMSHSFPDVLVQHEQWVTGLLGRGWRVLEEQSREEFLWEYNRDLQKEIVCLQENGELIVRDGRLYRPAGSAWRATREVFSRKEGTVEALRDQSNAVESKSLETEAMRCRLARKQVVDSGEGYPLLFMVSMVASFVAFGLWLGWMKSLLLLLVVFVHEAGHWIGMKLTGYRDPRIFFVPMLGGVAVSKRGGAKSAGQEVLMLLLGPMPGIIGALVVLVQVESFWEWAGPVQWLVVVVLLINYLNLLPVMPLDGWRVVQALFLRRAPQLGFLFAVLSLVALGTGAIYLNSWILGILAFFGCLRLRLQQFEGQLKARILRELGESGLSDRDDATREILRILQSEDIPEPFKPFPAKGALVNRVLESLWDPPPSRMAMAVGGAVYGVCLIVPLLVWWSHRVGF